MKKWSGRALSIDFEEWKKRRVEGAILAFTRGEKNINWVMGIIKGSWGVKGEELERIFNRIPHSYINYDKRLLEQLKQKCMEAKLV
jgi:hypothetical protein